MEKTRQGPCGGWRQRNKVEKGILEEVMWQSERVIEVPFFTFKVEVEVFGVVWQ